MITEEFGGQVAVSSLPDQGSAFFASFGLSCTSTSTESKYPDLSQRLQEIQTRQLRKCSEVITNRSSEEPARGKKVLVVDDEAYNCEVLSLMIESAGLPRNRFDVCLGGREALDLVISQTTPGNCPYQVILTDLSMPCIDGFQLTKRLRRVLNKKF